MNISVVDSSRARLVELVRSPGLVLGLFAATLFLSAALLFSIQPMFAKMVLPKLGGAPSVWAVAMCFFQAVLLLGYAWAHVLDRFLAPVHAVAAHLGALAIAFVVLPIALPAFAADPPDGDAYFWLIGVFAAGVGLPFFAVSANAPLLQSWFARTGHPHGDNPYFLYGASNLGSMLALFSYPVLLEPGLGLDDQAASWSFGFLVLALSITAAGATMLVLAGGRPQAEAGAPIAVAGDTPTHRRRLLWVGLAFVPSGLVTAVTTHVATDIASAPFIWIVPLALFLLTFVLVFTDRPWPAPRLLARALPFAFAVMLPLIAIGTTNISINVGASLIGFFIAALACHRALYQARPGTAHLTEFYLLMSVGGVLGGVFAGLVAPNVFTSVLEFPLLMALSLLSLPFLVAVDGDRKPWPIMLRIAFAGAAVVALAAALSGPGMPLHGVAVRSLAVVAAACMVAITSGNGRRTSTFALVGVLALAAIAPAGSQIHASRNFFGALRVVETRDGAFRLLTHGTTVHGALRIAGKAGSLPVRPVPATYYHPDGPMARSIVLARSSVGKPGRYGIIGLGTGALACLSQPGETWRYYEIDPDVIRIARDPGYFTYLPVCAPSADIVLGDARVKLEREAPASFDYLLIDAFSSDSIPVHLLTKEAIELYASRLAPGGVLAMHISNRHLHLAPIVAATAGAAGLTAIEIDDDKVDGFDRMASQVVLLAKDRTTIAPALAWQHARQLTATGEVWTDDYSNILGALLAKAMK